MKLREKLRTVRARLYLALALLLAMILLLAGVVAYESYKISAINLERQVQAGNLYQVTKDLEVDLLNMETGKRGFLLDGEERFLDPYKMGRKNFEDDLETARSINGRSGGEIVDPRVLDELEAQQGVISDLFRRQIEVRRGGETDPQALGLEEGKAEMDRARGILGRLQDQALASRQSARQNSLDAVGRQTAVAIGLGILALLTVLGSMLYVQRRIISPLQRLEDGASRVGSGDLEHRTGLRSADELGAVSSAFDAMLDRRREIEEALKGSEERFRGLSDATFEGVAITEGGRIIETNRAFARMFGYETSEVVGMHATDLVSEQSEELVRRNISSGNEEPYEIVGVRKDGTTMDVEVRGKMSSFRGNMSRVTAVRDITERKRAERALRESEMRLRTVTANAPIFLFATDRGGSFTFAEGKGLESQGLEPKDLVGRSVLDLFGDVPGIREHAERALAGHQEPFIAEADGRTSEVLYSPLLDEGGEIDGFIGVSIDITERRKAEERLREAEERYRSLVENVPAVVYTQEIDEPSRTTYISPQMTAMQGYTPEEILANPRHWVETLHPGDRERVLGEDRLTNETGEPFTSEYRQIAKDGSVVWVRDEAAMVRDGEGNPLYWQGVLLDITERKSAEEKLQETEMRFRAVAANTPVVIYAMDRRGVFTFVEGKGLEPLGIEPGDLVGRSVFDLYGDVPEIRDSVRSVLAGERTASTVDLGDVVYESLYSPLTDEGGNVTGVIGVSMDVTERRRAEGRLQEAEERYRTLVEQLPVAIYVQEAGGTDAPGDMVYMSPQIEAQSGYPPHRYVEDPGLYMEVIHPEDRERVGAEDRRTERTGEPFGVEYRVVRPDGSVVWVRDEARLIRDAGGNPRFWQGFQLDITDQQRAAERLAESEERYRLVAQATDEAIWDSDMMADRQTWNGAVDAMFGYPVGHVTDTAWWKDHVHPEDRERVVSEIDGVIRAGGDTWTSEYRFRRADGGYSTVVDRAYLVRDEAGNPVRMVGSMADVTERNEAQERLRASEAELRALFAAMDDVILVLDTRGRYERIAPTNPSLLYRPSEDLVGQTVDDVFPPEEAEAFMGHIRRAIEGGRPVETEYSLEIEGREVWFAGTVSPIDGDKVLYVARDITERTRVQQALRESEERYRSLFDGVPIGLYRSTPEGRLLDANAALVKILGFPSREALLEVDVNEVYVDPEDRHGWQRELARAGGVHTFESRLRRFDGRIIWTRFSLQASRDETGRILRYEGVLEDITDRRQAEAALRASEERFRALVQNASDLIAILEADGSVRYESPSHRRLLGHRPDDFAGKSFLDLVHPEDRALVAAGLRHLADQPHEIVTLEYRRRHRNGEWRCVESAASNLLTHPAVAGFVLNSHDVTDRRRAEERLLHETLHDELTGLPNRVLFMDRLKLSMERSRREPGRITVVLFLDVDRFKIVNDSLGHQAGDELLRVVAARIRGCLRDSDLLFRMGGDEFTVILPRIAAPEDAVCAAADVLGGQPPAPAGVTCGSW